MKRLFILIFSFTLVCNLYGQSIKTTVKEDFVARERYGMISRNFNAGEFVTIYAYKKKDDKYYFIVETQDYANLINCSTIPFNIEEKKLKKLPNALNDDAKEMLKEIQRELTNRKKQEVKKIALSEGYKAVIKYSNLISYGTMTGKVEEKDVVYIIGYKNEGYATHKWAFYSNKAAGIMSASSKEVLILDNKGVDLSFFPSIDDPDVLQKIEQKKEVVQKNIAEEKSQYRKKALSGEIKGFLTTSYLKSDRYSTSPLKYGDTVSVIGFKQEGSNRYYALSSHKAADIFKVEMSTSNTFSNSKSINFDNLPSVDDIEVKKIIERNQNQLDSARAVENERLIKELNTSKNNLIEIFRNKSPIIVEFLTWTSNSVGGIEVSLKVTNCSSQTIKYITFQGYFLNAVGDKCRNEIGGGTIWKAKGIGPIGPCPSSLDNFDERWDDCTGRYTFDNITFYSRIADRFFFSSVTIQYMNGKTVTLSGKNLDSHVIYN